MGELFDEMRVNMPGGLLLLIALLTFTLVVAIVTGYRATVALLSAFAGQRRAEAMRRLGGPDLDKERRENAMNGDQKMWVMVVMSGATLLGWVVWNIMTYHTAAAALAARSRPSPASMLTRVNHCAESCVGQDVEGVR
jgi:hypothetical protein